MAVRIKTPWQTDMLSYTVVLDGGAPVTLTPVPNPNGDGTVRGEFDVTDVAVGTHEIKFTADNGWEAKESNPLSFTRPTAILPFDLVLERY